MPDSPTFFSARRTNARLEAGRWTLAVAVFGSAMALGAVHTTVLLLVIPLLAASSWFIWRGAEPMRPRSAATLLFWTAALLTLFTLVQATPMPIGLLRVLAPQVADVWDRALLPLSEAGPSWATLSLDPIATRIQVIRGVAYLLTFVSAVRIANRREGSLFLEGALLATGIALAIAAWVHPALGVAKVFGVYQPLHDPGVRHVAPLLNSNTLSGYLNIGLCIAFGHAIALRPSIPRPITVALTAFLAATQFWVASRGGMIGMGTGLLLVFWMTRAPGPGERSRLAVFVPAVFLLAGVAMGVLSSSEQAWLELADSDVSKLQIGLRALRLVAISPVFGIGRGAFETVFPIVRNDAGHMLYTHPENIAAQWVTEWGPGVALLAATAILVALRPRSALTRSPRAAGAWGALACVGIHNLVDFSSEYPGVVISLTVCAALVVGGTSGVDSGRVADVWSKVSRRMAWGALAVGVLAALLGISAEGRELHADRLALHRDALDPLVTQTTFHAEVRAAMLRHPAEPYLPFTGALRAARAKDDSVVGWVERTLERAPIYGPAHLLLARALVSRSPAQARLEYRLAIEQAPELWFARTEALRLVHGYDDATEVVVQGRGRPEALDLVSQGLLARLPATSARIDLELSRLDPSSVSLAFRQAEAAVTDLQEGNASPWCIDERKRCLDRALALATRLERLTPSSTYGFAFHAESLMAGGDSSGAVKELSDACGKVIDRTVCLERLAALAKAAKADPPLSETLEQIAHAGCADVKECVDNLRWVAGFEQSRGNPRRAFAMLQRAHERDPSNDDLLAELARQASAVDLHAEAVRAYEDLARRHPEDPAWQVALAAEKEALVRGSAKL
jgi:tetratricopeptide (TPR) repeat protein